MPDFGDEGMPYDDEIPWHMSQRNPNDQPLRTNLPPGLDLETLYCQQIIEADEDIEHLRESLRVYRELLTAAFDAVHRQRSYIVTLHGQIASLQNRRQS